MTTNQDDDDLKPTFAEGYKPGQKKTLDEYANLDKEDESLARWKESLGIKPGGGPPPAVDPNDPRKAGVVIISLAMEVAGRDDVVLDMSNQAAIENLRKTPFTIKEGTMYQLKVKFRIQHDVVSGLRYIQTVKRLGVRVDKCEEMIGSYGPNTNSEPYERKCIYPSSMRLITIVNQEEAPKGMMARGDYEATSAFVDDDCMEHIRFHWAFKISKSW
ncbi:Rho GDP-dissociation inhibitor [Neolecta irregularis DAH-3]|uniref:Rho GDP-dissociation inhibitor n=1 Tax=Neolecta irregularis (strain DAH-3) TaxID=1198029 RepID=A0A1U7LGG0_NEOID|nr:Rho GDP-dissociation inhibitor [Neolecta irregularis DAH-3]|eukprot:OLL21683.1 Rho GDP-dissociation inhibitor [Neolecta irregularis DAH-3]